MRGLAKERAARLEKIGEPCAGLFEPAGIAAILRSHGFCDIEDLDFPQIASRFGRAILGLAPGQAGVHVVHPKQKQSRAGPGSEGA
jgi:hypothetical protein